MNGYLLASALIAICLVSWISYSKGYESGQTVLIADHNEELARIQQENAHKLQEKQNEILEVENAWLETDRSTRVVYRDKVRKVVETVTKYVNSNHLDRCRIDDDSVQQINQALRGGSAGNDPE
ncbi:MAG: hypothetical protein DSZ27_08455 [Thiomicrospira sp.]|nr:MAG: hypothetical protein DSZ27_08455 [Thiomicrospira sp.]